MQPRTCSSLFLALACSTTALLGCSPDLDRTAIEQAVGTVPQPIQGGYLDEFDTQVVGLVHISNMGYGACSGTLISPNVVLTARHCVAPVNGNGSVQCGVTVFGPQYQANELYATTHTAFTMNAGDYHAGMEIAVPPGGSDFCGNDQAILILAQPVDPTEAVPSVPRVDAPLAAGEEYYAVGYGQLYDDQNAPSGTRYRRDQLFTQCVAEGCPGGYVAVTEFVGDTGVCSGDSGGPAYDLADRVTGVASRGGAGCSSPVYGHVQGWGKWIQETTVYAAGLAGIDPPPWATGWPTDPAFSQPVGQGCAQPADCPSNICLDGYCTRICNEQAPCEEGYECRAEDGICVRIPEPPPPPAKKSGSEQDSGCAVTDAGKDPTKPIPWSTVPALLGLLWLLRRRRAPARVERAHDAASGTPSRRT